MADEAFSLKDAIALYSGSIGITQRAQRARRRGEHRLLRLRSLRWNLQGKQDRFRLCYWRCGSAGLGACDFSA